MADGVYDNEKDPAAKGGDGGRDQPESGTDTTDTGQQNTGRGKSDEGGASLGEREASAARPGSDDEKKALSPGQLKSAEDNTPWGGLWKDSDGPKTIKSNLKSISGRRKVFATLGIGGVVGLALAILTTAPIFRIPSLMGGIMGFVGEQVEDVIEHRAQRMVISYLIQQAGGNPDNYVIRGSLVDSLWQTYRVNKLETRIKEQTGFEIKRGDDGQMHLLHKDQDLGVVTSYDDVLVHVQEHPSAIKDFRKITRVLTKPTEFLFSSKMKKAFERRYLVRMSMPEKDPSLTDEQNEEKLKQSQIEVVANQNTKKIIEGMGCLTSGTTEACAAVNESDQPPSAEHPPTTDATTKDSANKFGAAAEAAAEEAKNIAAKTGESYVDVFKRTLIGKLAAVAGVVTAIIEAVDLAFVAIVMTDRFYQNEGLSNFPSAMAASASGAMFAQWQGFGDNIEAGKAPLLYIKTLNEQVEGAETGMAYKMAFNGEVNEGVPPHFRVDSNAKYPAQAIMSFMRTYEPTTIVRLQVANLWFNSVHQLINKAGEWADAIITFLTANAMGRILEAIFGENWQQRAFEWAIDVLVGFFAANIDALATGAAWSNQVIIGGQAAMNTYCKVNLGCRALTAKIDQGIFDSPLFYNGSQNYISQRDRLNMASLPLHDRLFSLDEPNSLLNETFRSLPSDNSPAGWLTSTFGQVAALPGRLVASITSRTNAATPTLEQQAALGGVQIFGGLPEDFAKDIAAEVRQIPGSPTCPPNDPQNTFNVCQADKEIVGGMMCQYTDCPEYVGLDRPDSTSGLLANMRQLWASRQGMGVLW